ncbi:hypothetical protein [Tautonia plasticadhaerens]|uniref:CTCHY-type domain-containing protein n=1 Tax=Tautonia plasticadhaerens TaxID=2527974 RepID=A0A518HEK0_9BACT|nr:hypothetical protein [Tautonia plasticadhaerens]QDV39279.1 hypothetical protein ElP_72430 [Tautonia plasticadhaerens]
MPFHIQLDHARMNAYWCDRCGRVVDSDREPYHFHLEQCGGCRMFRRIDEDWGWCRNRKSVYCGRLMFEHDTCSVHA